MNVIVTFIFKKGAIMKKIMCTRIVLCGLLSSSLVMFGMEEQQKIQQLTHSGKSSPRSESPVREKGKKANAVLDGIRAAEDVFYGATNPIVEAVVENAQLGVDFAAVGGADKYKAQYVTDNKVVAIAALVDKTQDTLHVLIQDLGKSRDDIRKSHDSDDAK